MLKFVSFLHLQNRHEKHTKICDKYKSQINSNQLNNNNNSTHKNIKKFTHKTCDKTSNAITEKPPLAGYLKIENVKKNSAKSTNSNVANTTVAAATANGCCTSEAGQFRRCSRDDRCATGTSCPTTGCCCCCTAGRCSTARFRSASTLCGSCCTAIAPWRIPYCRLSTGICPIRQQLQWAHGAAFNRISTTRNCYDCCTAECLTDRQQLSAGRKASCASSCCATNEDINVCSSDLGNNNCAYCCCTHNYASSLEPTAKQPTAFKLSSIKPETSLTPIQMKLKLLTGTAANCC